MMFCPKCKTMMIPKKFKGKTVLACGSCSYTNKKVEDKVVINERVSSKAAGKIDVVEEKDNMLPTTSAICGKCENKTAYFWTMQTRASDEPETKFLKCTKCKHTWREYD